jgi:orotate phosphoribosyltransferase
VIEDVTLSSGRRASYYVDARRTLLLPEPFKALGRLVAPEAKRLGATAVGGPTLGADPVACAAIATEEGDALKGFFVRKERKAHGLQRWIEGPPLERGERVLVVEDVVTSGGSLVEAIERLREEDVQIAGALAVVDRLAGGREAIEKGLGDARLPYVSLFTIDDVYPDRPDR